MENRVGLFYGSDTGNTDDIVKDILKIWDGPKIDLIEGSDLKVDEFEKYSLIIIGLSTWYDGDLQSDWENFYEDFKDVDFSGKTVAIFGLGDQVGYPEYFVDGIGILAEIIFKNGGNLIGFWPVEGYNFTTTKPLYNEEFFYGLALDQDSQSQLTKSRIKIWLKKVKNEFEFIASVENESHLYKKQSSLI